MPRNTDGTYVLPAGNPVQSGTLITSAWGNTTFEDLATQLNNLCTGDGKLGMTGQFRGQYVAPGRTISVGWVNPANGSIIDGFGNGGGDQVVIYTGGNTCGFWWTERTEFRGHLVITGELLRNGEDPWGVWYPLNDLWYLENGGSSVIPGPGEAALNNITPLNATLIRIYKTSANNRPTSFMQMAVGDLLVSAQYSNSIQQVTAFTRWKATGLPVDMGTYIEIPIAQAQTVNGSPQEAQYTNLIWFPKR